jgi:hypothetical protein
MLEKQLNIVDSSYQLRPPRRQECIPVHLKEKLYAALATRLEKEKAEVKAMITLDEPIIQYGRVSIIDGDTIVAHDMVRRSEDSRDSSYIKASILSLLWFEF